MSYLGNLTVGSIPSGVIVANNAPLVTSTVGNCNGGTVNFDFGNVLNTNNNSAQEVISLEFNALVCNIASNQNLTTLNNSVRVLVNGQQVATSNTVLVVVVEPNVNITKAVIGTGATVTYQITLTNNGTATAFDVHLTDQLPGCLSNLSNIQTSAPATNASGPLTLNLTFASIAMNGTVTVQYSAKANCDDCDQLTNTAKVTSTSLPGPLGTTSNPTGSPTPGGSGTLNGERDGSGGINDYVAFASTSLCSVLVTNDSVSCASNGTFSETFTVTNLTGFPLFKYQFTPISPANVTITPATVNATIPVGGTINVTLTIAGAAAVPGTIVCFAIQPFPNAIVIGPTTHCITLPNCCVAPPSGMVAWYPFDETQGATSINDIAPPPSSLVNNVATPLPGAVGAGGPLVVTGLVRGALFFAGEYAEVPSQSELNFGGGSFSIDAWVRVFACTPGGLSVLVDKLDVGANAGYAFYIDQPTTASVGVLRLRLNGTTFTSGGTLPANAAPLANIGPWVHVAVTFDASTGAGTFYINGTAAGTFTAPTGPISNTLPMWIGKSRVGSGVCEVATDELEIFNRALTTAEVQSLHDAGAVGKCTMGQLCVFNFEDLNGNGVRDPIEPSLFGWTFRVVDANNNLVGTISGPNTNCLLLARPGRYTIVEQVMDGWAPTTGSSQTVTISPGQTVNVSFGNRVVKRRRAAGK